MGDFIKEGCAASDGLVVEWGGKGVVEVVEGGEGCGQERGEEVR